MRRFERLWEKRVEGAQGHALSANRGAQGHALSANRGVQGHALSANMGKALALCFVFFLLALFVNSGAFAASEKPAALIKAESDYRNKLIGMSELLDAVQAYNEGASESEKRGKKDSPEEVTAVHSAEAYTPGENMTVSGVITYSGELMAIGIGVVLPDGWMPVSITAEGKTFDLSEGGIFAGEWGAVFRSPNILEVYWVWIPESPIELSYVVAVPDEESADIREISAEVLYRWSEGGERRVMMTTPNPLPLKRSNDSCADSDNDGVIDPWDQCAETPENAWVNKIGCPPTDAEMLQAVQAVTTWGDIDGDQKIGLAEAIHALQVSSGSDSSSTKR